MGLILIFNRKVIPLSKTAAKVETAITGFSDGEAFDCGHVRFPTAVLDEILWWAA